MNQIYLNCVAAGIICLWAVWCVINPLVDDGLVGKIIFTGLAISAFANFIEPLTAYSVQREAEISMHFFFALSCIRHFILTMIWPGVGRKLLPRFFPAVDEAIREEKSKLKRRRGDEGL